MTLRKLLALSFLLLPMIASAHKFETDQRVPPVGIADRGELILDNDKFSYKSWNSAQLPGKVRIVQHIAGRTSAKEKNATLIEAIKTANLPSVAVHDLVIHPRERDLAIATYGRAIWVGDIAPLQERLSGEALDALVATADIVLDCTDNFATRHAINRACVHHRKPLVSGAAIRFDGQISVYDLRHDDAPCYHCLFPEGEDVEEVRCAVMGVFAPLTGIVGTMQAAEALKLAAGIGESLNGRLLLLDALSMEWRTVRFKKDAGCAVCGNQAAAAQAE